MPQLLGKETPEIRKEVLSICAYDEAMPICLHAQTSQLWWLIYRNILEFDVELTYFCLSWLLRLVCLDLLTRAFKMSGFRFAYQSCSCARIRNILMHHRQRSWGHIKIIRAHRIIRKIKIENTIHKSRPRFASQQRHDLNSICTRVHYIVSSQSTKLEQLAKRLKRSWSHSVSKYDVTRGVYSSVSNVKNMFKS